MKKIIITGMLLSFTFFSNVNANDYELKIQPPREDGLSQGHWGTVYDTIEVFFCNGVGLIPCIAK